MSVDFLRFLNCKILSSTNNEHLAPSFLNSTPWTFFTSNFFHHKMKTIFKVVSSFALMIKKSFLTLNSGNYSLLFSFRTLMVAIFNLCRTDVHILTSILNYFLQILNQLSEHDLMIGFSSVTYKCKHSDYLCTWRHFWTLTELLNQYHIVLFLIAL